MYDDANLCKSRRQKSEIVSTDKALHKNICKELLAMTSIFVERHDFDGLLFDHKLFSE